MGKAELLQQRAISRFREEDFTLIPCRGKIPIPKDWSNADYDPQFSCEGNYGIVLQQDDLVIDCDPRNYPEGRDVCSELMDDLDLGVNPDTFIVRTGSGGLHIYFKKSPDLSIKETIDEYPGLEFKSKGRQVIGPGSIHPDTGRMYTVLSGSLSDIMKAPSNLLEMVKNKYRPKKELSTPEYRDDEANITAFMAYLRDDAPLAVAGQMGDSTTYAVAAAGKDYGLSPNMTYEVMKAYWNPHCQPPWGAESLRKKVGNAYKYGQDEVGSRNVRHYFDSSDETGEDPDNKKLPKFQWKKSGELKSNMLNIANLFMYPIGGNKKKSPLFDILQYNMLTRSVEYKRPPPWQAAKDADDIGWEQTELTDDDVIQAQYYLLDQYKVESPDKTVITGMRKAALKNSYHPVKDWLDSLEWDGIKRLDGWLSKYCDVVRDRYTRAIGTKALMAAIARVYHPGIKFDHMLILEGEQGIGKSTAVAILGGDWYCDIDIKYCDKDTVNALRGQWIVEASELTCLRQKEVHSMKGFISRQVDRVRLPYMRLTDNFARQCIIIGTINPESTGYLKDTTGNRRYWPVWCRSVDMSGLRKDRDQLFAEARIQYENGGKLYLDNEAVHKDALLRADMRKQCDPWKGIIQRYLKDFNINSSTLEDIYCDAIGGSRRSFGAREQERVVQALRTIHWTVNGDYAQRYTKKQIDEMVATL